MEKNNSKPNLSVNKKSKYHQGKFTPINPHKYIGNPTNIIYRSKWELYFLRWADTTSKVLRYGSEELVIPYISPIDNKKHRYYMDFYMEVLQADNSIKTFLVEIKPFAQTQIPKLPKSGAITESYKDAVKTYMINQSKWSAAKKVCNLKGWSFSIITEKELFKNKGKSRGKRK